VESCPAEAFTGRRFAEEEPREARMDSMKCHNYPSKMEEDKGARVCASCVAVCPFGKK
jgi:epoxyqueuosine reductase QueG